MGHLVIEKLSKQFETRDEPLPVLKNISLQLASGNNLGVLGPSGSGKSTLLHLLGTLDRPSSGQITLDGQDPLLLDEARLADFRRDKIGFVFQDHHLLPQLSALENVLLPMIAAGPADSKAASRALELLNLVGLDKRRDHRPAELSGGERQRVAVARSLVHRPTLLLADEPTGNLDRATAGAIAELLLEVQDQEEMMMIVVTHSQDVARRLDQQAELNDGILEILE